MQRQEKKNRIEKIPSDEDKPEDQEEPTEDCSATAEEEPAQNEPRGMIPVPAEMRRLWKNQSQEHYADRLGEPDEASTGTVRMKGRKYVGRMVVGSLAGFMVLDGFAISNRKAEKRKDRATLGHPFATSFPTYPPSHISLSRNDATSVVIPPITFLQGVLNLLRPRSDALLVSLLFKAATSKVQDAINTSAGAILSVTTGGPSECVAYVNTNRLGSSSSHLARDVCSDFGDRCLFDQTSTRLALLLYG